MRRILFFAATALIAHHAAIAQELNLFNVPPLISESAEPNLVLTFDDSRSMYYGFVPDVVGNSHATKRAKSSHFNKLYYDPDVTYLPPIKADGEAFPAASFRAALTNPFNGAQINVGNPAASISGDDGSRIRSEPVQNVVDLQLNYAVRWNAASDHGEQDPAEPVYPLQAADSSSITSAYYYRYDASRPGCSVDVPENDDCYVQVQVSATSGVSRPRSELGVDADGNTVVSTDETQNFANWYQYYSLRVLMAKTVVSRALAPGNINGGVRIARQSLNIRTPVSGPVTNPRNTVTPLNEDRANLYEWLFNLQQGDQSQLRSAMSSAAGLLRRTSVFKKTPWISGNQGNTLSCRSNYHLMVSDGLWSAERTFVFPGSENADNQSTALPDGKQYPASSPLYAQLQSRTVADLAFYYWATDMNSLPNNVKPVYRRRSDDANADYWDYRNDPATWQHITTYAMSFGVTGDVPVTAQALDDMQAGRSFTNNRGEQQNSWPFGDMMDSDATWKIDDVYHASINSRGDFFSAQNPDAFAQAMAAFASAIASDHVSYSPLAVNTSAIATGATMYRAEYNGATNAGDLKAFQVANGDGTPCIGEIGTLCSSPLWQANRAGNQTSTVFTYDPVARRGVSFAPDAEGFTAAMRSDLRGSGENDERVNQRIAYVRGDVSREQANGGTFRNRSTYQRTLGPIVNSAPLFVGNGINANGSRERGFPDNLESQQSSKFYGQFLQSISNRVPMVYVGSNDGKLHAYNALSGADVFDYVPHAVFPALQSLSSPSYSFRPGVDGLLNSSDVYINDEWRTVLVGGLRTGGMGFYALDVTHPADNDAQQRVLWEVTNSTRGAEKLGYSFGRASIVKSNIPASGGDDASTKWVAIVGNGYNSTGGEAVLLVIDIETGEVIRSISTQPGSPTPEETTANGLATPAVVFADDNYTADYVYAGDLRGNLWKFDISSPRPDDWKVAYGVALTTPDSASYRPEPLFTAVDSNNVPQPITASPVVAGNPVGRAGFMIYFGTGKYIEAGDHQSDSVQSFYGIWDKDMCLRAGSVSCIEVAAGDRNHTRTSFDRRNLAEQRITGVSVGERIVSDNNVDWDSQYGWRLDFPAGERVIAQATLRGGMVVFPTFVPGVDACRGMGTSWLMALSRVNGGLLDQRPFSRNNGDMGNDGYGQQRAAGVAIDARLNEVLIMGCGGRSCMATDDAGGMEQIDEGMQWGRWQWLQMQGGTE